MAAPRVTLEEVIKTATDLTREGVHPSVATVREALGGRGSFTTITKHLQTWREQSEETAANVELPEEVEAAYRHAAVAAWGEAYRIAHEEADRIKEQAAEREARLVKGCTETAAEVERLENLLQEHEAKAKAHAEELATIRESEYKFREECARFKAESEAKENRISEVSSELANLKVENKQLLKQAGKLEAEVQLLKSPQ